ncbi:glycoside hydrolase 15 protein [Quaeritorhiza haematococci]|nr:glycoside hydrolase 15 protein [Quaeritorhiza haematococci]
MGYAHLNIRLRSPPLQSSALVLDTIGRPHNDGPALRASTLIRFANAYLAKGGDKNVIRSKLYDGLLPTNTVVKVDLEYVENHWREKSVDLWSNVALSSKAPPSHTPWAISTHPPSTPPKPKPSNPQSMLTGPPNPHASTNPSTQPPGLSKDPTATILGVIHGYSNDRFYSPTNERVLATLEQIRQDFETEYNIAGIKVDEGGLPLGTPFGRYKEDVYDGTMWWGSRGNPWVLATLGVAEMYYAAVGEYRKAGIINITTVSLPFFRSLNISTPNLNLAANATFTKGTAEFDSIINALAQTANALIRRVKFHVGPSRRMAEQFSKDTGTPLS